MVALAACLGTRRRRLAVTLYSEPGYRGRSQRLSCDSTVCALSATRLNRVGSVRVQRSEHTFRRAGAQLSFLRIAVDPYADPDSRKEALAWLPLALLRAADPSSWRRERDPAGDRQSWVRLWAGRPGVDQERHDVLADTADLGEWATRTRYLEVGVRNPHRDGPPGLAVPENLTPGRVQCSECDGLGWCTLCEGRGWGEGRTWGGHSSRAQCPWCKGNRVCHVCRGEGEL